jgi:hypothetical protein
VIVIKSSGVSVGRGVARVCRRLWVSGRSIAFTVGICPCRRSEVAWVFAYQPIVSARGAEPKGVEIAWWYCARFTYFTTCAISVGFVRVFQGAFQVFGIVGLPHGCLLHSHPERPDFVARVASWALGL